VTAIGLYVDNCPGEGKQEAVFILIYLVGLIASFNILPGNGFPGDFLQDFKALLSFSLQISSLKYFINSSGFI